MDFIVEGVGYDFWSNVCRGAVEHLATQKDHHQPVGRRRSLERGTEAVKRFWESQDLARALPGHRTAIRQPF